MTVRRSRSIPPPTVVDRDMPYQVALPDDICTAHNFTLILRFHDERGLPCRTRSVIAIWQDGKQEEWRLHCFAKPEAAAAFLDHFGGVMFDPKRDRDQGRARGVWRRAGPYRRVLEIGPLSVPEMLRK